MNTKRRRVPVTSALLSPIAGQPWAIDPHVLKLINALSKASASMDTVELRAGFGFGGGPGAPNASPIRIIPVYGPISNHATVWSEYFGGASIDGLRRDLRAAVDDQSVKAIVFAINSPGGEVMGMTEFAAEVRGMRGGAKPIVAMIDTYAHSAAYWLAAQCDEIVITPSGTAGSVGIYTIYEEVSGALAQAGITETVIGSTDEKIEALGLAPLSSDAEASIRAMVEAHAVMFTRDVANGRNTTPDVVSKTYGAGRALMAKDALAIGMVDRIDTMAATLARLLKSTRSTSIRAEGEPREMVADSDDGGELIPFTVRLEHLAAESDAVTNHASKRADLRGKEGRAPFSSKQRDALRSIHGRIGELLTLGEATTQAESDPVDEPPAPAPEAPAPVVDPPVAAAPAPAPAVRAPRFSSREEWLEHLQEV